MFLFVELPFFFDLFEPFGKRTVQTDEFVAFGIVLVLFFTDEPFHSFQFLLYLPDFFLQQGKPLVCRFFGKVQFGSSVFHLFAGVEQTPETADHLVRLFTYDDFSLFVRFDPEHDVVVFLFKSFYLAAVIGQVDSNFFFVHGLDNRILDEIGIQFRIEEHILDGAGNILIFGTFHYGEFSVSHHVRFAVIAEYDVAEDLITGYQ